MNSIGTNSNRMQFFATALLLKTLSEEDAVHELEGLCRSCSAKGEGNGLILGHKLVLEALLFKQLDLIVTSPQILHLPVAQELSGWWSRPKTRSSRGF